MILPDTSAWVEFFRGTDSEVDLALRALLSADDIVTSEIVVMELLSGESSEEAAAPTRSALLEYPVVPLRGVGDYEAAARIYRTCRTWGDTIRSLADCLIAVVAMRADASILHRDRDFDVIARHTDLRIEPVNGRA